MKPIAVAVLIVSLILLSSFASGFQKAEAPAKGPSTNVEADVAAIKALIADWARLYNAEDFDRLMTVFYTENAILMSPNAPIRKGKEAILLSYRKDAQLNIEHVESSVAEEVRVSGNLAVAWGNDTGTTSPRSGGEPAKYDLKWLMVFERQPDGAWKCLYEIWNDNPAASTRSQSVEQELIKLENEWNEAWLKRDVKTYARLLADDYISTNSYGDMMTKAQCIDRLKSYNNTASLLSRDFRARVYGDAAVVTHRLTYKNLVQGRESTGQDQITDVWVMRDSRWQCVATHSSQMAQK